MRRLLFYFQYAFRNIQRGGRWVALAILCIAAGVATVVALRGLGLSIAETLVSDVRGDFGGDVRLIKGGGDSDQILNVGTEDAIFFSEQELSAIRTYVTERGGHISEFVIGGNIQIIGIDGGGVFSTSQFIETYLVDPATYPAVGDIDMIEPAGVSFADVFTGGAQIVISENMAEAQGMSVGDRARIARTEQEFEIVGIVAADEEAGIRNILGAFFGFAYIDIDVARQYIDPDLGVNQLLIAFDEPLQSENRAQVVDELLRRGQLTTPSIDYDTAIAQLERNEVIAQVLGDFIVVLGLGALLIGGVGIMNTMLVLVRRRTTEIAAMKTFGMKGRQVALIFLAEGTLLGLIGSALGIVLGVVLGGVVNAYGERFIQQSLLFRIHGEALLYGVTLGMVTTMIFSLVPVATTLEIRPGILLRPNETHIARLGILRTIGMMLLITLLLGLVVGRIIAPTFGLSSAISSNTPYITGVIFVAVTLALLGILTFVLWLLVWLIGKLPAFGSVDLRLALRNLSTQKTRTATTLLALIAGMFALSSITFVGQGTRELLNVQISKFFGGNVIAVPISPGGNPALLEFARTQLNNAIADVPGVNARSSRGFMSADLLSVDGVDYTLDNRTIENNNSGPPSIAQTAPYQWDNLTVWRSDAPDIYARVLDITAGRNLTPADVGQRVMVVPRETAGYLGAEIGSQVTYELNGDAITYTVVGMYTTGFAFGGTGPVVPHDATNGKSPNFQIFAYDVDDEHANRAIAELSAVRVPPTVALNVKFFDSFLSNLIDQFAAIPTVVGLLSLAAAAVIMANTVALSTLERRRQIGVLKAIGLKRRRVLFIMLVESTIVGLLSAIIGIGISWLAIWLFGNFSGIELPLPRSAQAIAIGLTIAAVLIGWVATFISANVAVRERVMNVLRNE